MTVTASPEENNDKIKLTPEQEKLVLDAFQNTTNANLPSITQLVRLAFPNIVDVDGRSAYGRAIKSLLAVKGLQARTTATYVGKGELNLTEEQKEFVRNNKDLMSPVEMAKIVFGNPAISNLHQETRAIANLIKSQNPSTSLPKEVTDVPDDEYRPPRTVAGVLQRVEKFVFNSGIDKENITAQQRAGLEALLSYMNTFHFIHQINLYEKQTSRDLFESSFVRYTYDKHDLTEEECGQYITLAHEVVIAASIQVRIERLQTMMEEQTQTAHDAQAKISLSTSIVEHINNLQTEYNQCVKRSQALLNDLKQKRSDRIAALRAANASILNLVQLWREEKSRLKFIHLADARKELLRKKAHELAGMEEIKARIMGLHLDETIDA